MKAALALGLLLAVSGCLEGLLGERPVSPYDYIRDSEYTVWRIEIDYVDGHRPSPDAVAALKDRMGELVRKDQIITHVSPRSVGAGQAQWTTEDILALHAATQDLRTEGDTVVSHVLYLNGRYLDDEGKPTDTLGLAIGYGLAVVFLEAVRDACSPLRACFFSETEIEKAVLIHEFGHLIGLVNRGVPMVVDREHPEHSGHSTNPRSVMYWAVDSSFSLLNLSQIPTRFDQQDRQDICAAGGRCR